VLDQNESARPCWPRPWAWNADAGHRLRVDRLDAPTEESERLGRTFRDAIRAGNDEPRRETAKAS